MIREHRIGDHIHFNGGRKCTIIEVDENGGMFATDGFVDVIKGNAYVCSHYIYHDEVERNLSMVERFVDFHRNINDLVEL